MFSVFFKLPKIVVKNFYTKNGLRNQNNNQFSFDRQYQKLLHISVIKGIIGNTLQYWKYLADVGLVSDHPEMLDLCTFFPEKW